ncbi:hypothetical protein [Bradyrhizobium sp.]|uniref:hypothetical protein n=1 Tax=Bradyrhizobium sp. TaxID=376 RepID=UPI002D2472D6|nr:hypothetical protein [Bradyrhizobium sp.]HZR76040.1 hypothetical protein [Bradyrhizobium sp.]
MSAIAKAEPLSLLGKYRSLRALFRNEYQHIRNVALGFIAFWRTRKTPMDAYQSMIRLFCVTGGKSNDFISRCLSFLHPPYRIDKPAGILNIESESARSEAIETLRETGLYVFPTRVPDEVCDELLQIALTQQCTIFLPSGEKATGLYDRANPKAVRYAIQPDTLLNQPAAQRLISDKSLIWFAQTYLGAKPVLDHAIMWWITNINETPDSDAAQFYHFDMDKVKFLKFFLYLTDVGADSGPHCFVKGSQKTGGIPAALLDRGYARLPDEDVEQFYRSEDMVEIGGPKGTIFAEDTRGLHKGKHLLKGDRLLFQLEFSNSLFGATRNGPVLSKIRAPEFADALSRYPRVYSHIDVRAR